MVEASGTDAGDLAISFADGCQLATFVNQASRGGNGDDEFWRLLPPPVTGDEPHFVISARGVERCIRFAFEYARTFMRKRVTLVAKTNVLRFAQQATDSVNAMISGEAWLITGNFGNEDRVKDGGGPEIKGYIPKEGTVGWMDAEMIIKDGANTSLLFPYLEKAEQAENIAANFIKHGRPLFSEKAYQVLVDQGEKDRDYDAALHVSPEI